MRAYHYLGRQRGLTRLIDNQLFVVDTEARDIATWIIETGVWETHVDGVLEMLVRPDDTVFDIGANMGYYSVRLGGKLGPQGRIYSFEPNPGLFEVLQDNMRINHLHERSRLFRNAVGAHNGPVQFSFHRRYPGGGQVNHVEDGREMIEVDMVRIDDVAPPDCVADLIKIDVEGYEPFALAGMSDVLARSPQAIIVMEASFPQWSTYGAPSLALRKIAGDRHIYRIHRNGFLEQVGDAALDQILQHESACYILILPPTAENLAKVRAYQEARFPRPMRWFDPRRWARSIAFRWRHRAGAGSQRR